MSHFILGAGGHCKSVISSAQAQGLEISGILDIKPKSKKILNCKVLEENSHKWNEKNKYLIAVRDSKLKKKLINKIYAKIKYPKFFNIIHPTSVVSEGVNLGTGICILANSYIGPDTVIGDHVCINSACVIEHDCIIGDETYMSPSVNVAGSVIVGKETFLGINSSIADNISISANTIVGASSLVLSNIKVSNQTFNGTPAKPI